MTIQRLIPSQKLPVAIAWMLLSCLPIQVNAHAILVASNPAREAKLQTAPESIELRFDSPVGKRYLALAVVDSMHRRVDTGNASRDLIDQSIVRVGLKHPLSPGEYLVRYRVQSADGHIVTGGYRFTVVGERRETESKSVWDRLVDLFTTR